MEPIAWAAVALLFAAVFLCWLDLRRHVDTTAETLVRRLLEEDDMPDPVRINVEVEQATGAVRIVPDALRDPRELLAPPPMIDGVTVRDWLINHTHRDGVWAEVVTEFYDRAAAVPEVADYFRVILARPGGREYLETHFTRALVLVTHHGVTRGLKEAMRVAHAPIRSSDGHGITSGTWDAVIGTLVDVLKSKGVTEQGIAALATTIAPFRAAIVREG